MEKVPKGELTDPEHRDAFDKIRETLSNTQDLGSQLRALYKVSNFSEFALGLMWIANKVERDPTKFESSTDEEIFVYNLLKKAFVEVSDGDGAPSVEKEAFGSGSSQPEVNEQAVSTEAASIAGTDSQTSGLSEFGATPAPASAEGAGSESNEQSFSTTLERLLEAIQSGSDDRNALLEDLTREAESIVSQPGSADDYKAFCGYMIEFLKYITANQLFDDIRVMNMMSNVYDPFSQWAKADPSARIGMLDQPIEILREFKTLFE